MSAGEKLENLLSRIVVIIWVFVVLILTSSYTASLTSMLTVQQLQPTVTDLHELQNNGEYVGYPINSFVKGLLMQLNFDERRMRGYSYTDEYVEALKKGSHSGGVAAIVHEIPYIKQFLSKYCKGYMMVGPIYKTAGFGFVSSVNLLLAICMQLIASTEIVKVLILKENSISTSTSSTINLHIAKFVSYCLLQQKRMLQM